MIHYPEIGATLAEGKSEKIRDHLVTIWNYGKLDYFTITKN
jgi:hypothetical protein